MTLLMRDQENIEKGREEGLKEEHQKENPSLPNLPAIFSKISGIMTWKREPLTQNTGKNCMRNTIFYKYYGKTS